MTKVEALKKALVAMDMGDENSYADKKTVLEVLKQLAVNLDCAYSTDTIRGKNITEVLNYIAENYDDYDDNEPFVMMVTKCGCSNITIAKNGVEIDLDLDYEDVYDFKTINDILYQGDKLTIIAEPITEGADIKIEVYDADGELKDIIQSGDEITVDDGSLSFEIEEEINISTNVDDGITVKLYKKDDIWDVDEEWKEVSDENKLYYYNGLKIELEYDEEAYTLDTFTVNGEDFTSGDTIDRLEEPIEIVATASPVSPASPVE